MLMLTLNFAPSRPHARQDLSPNRQEALALAKLSGSAGMSSVHSLWLHK